MSAKRSIARFLMFRRQYPDSYAIWHSRIATHGVKNEANCHPYQVGADGLTYLAHNGVLDVDMAQDDRRSDSRVFAEEILPILGGVSSLDNGTVFAMVSKWASGSKLAILTLDPRAKHRLYIINERAGTWDDHKVWWSNTYHRPAKVYDWGGYTPGESHRTSAHEPHNMTKVISVFNESTNIWEEPEGTMPVYRGWKAGDVWDTDLQQFRTPAPGTVVTLPSVRGGVTAELDNLEKGGDDEVLEVPCPSCQMPTNLAYDPDYCVNCFICFECGSYFKDCLCYIPKNGYGVYRGNGY